MCSFVLYDSIKAKHDLLHGMPSNHLFVSLSYAINSKSNLENWQPRNVFLAQTHKTATFDVMRFYMYVLFFIVNRTVDETEIIRGIKAKKKAFIMQNKLHTNDRNHKRGITSQCNIIVCSTGNNTSTTSCGKKQWQ